MKVVVIGGKARSLMHFRGPLLRAMRGQGHDVVACAPDDEPGIDERLAEIGVRFVPIPMRRARIDPLSDLNTIRFLYALLSKERPQACLCYTIKPVIYGSIAARLAGVPRRYSMITGLGHSFFGDSVRRKILTLLVKRMYRAALQFNECVFFQNPDDQQLFINEGLLASNVRSVVLNGSGIDMQMYERSAPVTQPITFLWMGRLLREKGVIELIEASRQLRAQGVAVKVQLLGLFDVNPSAIGPDEVDAWEREGVIEFLGATKDVRPFVDQCSVLVYPSYREGTPRAVLEAMAIGRAIITTDVPGCRETVKHEHNGYLVPAKNAASIAEAMMCFVRDPTLIETMAEKSYALAKEKYDVHGVNEVILNNMALTGSDAA